MRINKYLAECGIASRRNSEQLILDGRVKVNNKLITNLATDIDVDNDLVSVDNKKVSPINKHIYIMLNKPKGVVSTTVDEHGRKTVVEYIPKKYAEKRLFPVGRLDYETEGLIILTTDGELTNRLTHPRHEVAKTYQVRVEGTLLEEELNIVRAGVTLDGEKLKKCRIKILEIAESETRLEIVITEGKNRQIRRMFETINRHVTFLKRVAIGELRLGGLSRGEARELKEKEIFYLKNI